jgi:hypothetical protein
VRKSGESLAGEKEIIETQESVIIQSDEERVSVTENVGTNSENSNLASEQNTPTDLLSTYYLTGNAER